jgi:hypothetical protein
MKPLHDGMYTRASLMRAEQKAYKRNQKPLGFSVLRHCGIDLVRAVDPEVTPASRSDSKEKLIPDQKP